MYLDAFSARVLHRGDAAPGLRRGPAVKAGRPGREELSPLPSPQTLGGHTAFEDPAGEGVGQRLAVRTEAAYAGY